MKKKKEGRPAKFATPKELQEKIEDYFKNGVAKRNVVVGPPNNRSVELIEVPTITGLIIYCGFCDRQSFYALEKNPKFSYTIKKARLAIEQNYEELLQTGLGAGAIFALKNFGWIDKTDIEHSMSESTIDKFAQLSVTDLLSKANALVGKSAGKS